MDEPTKPIIVPEFRIAPCAIFRCLECDDWLKVVQNMDDILSTTFACQWCYAEYRVTWQTSEKEVSIEMTERRI